MLNGSSSEYFYSSKGVPQGSVLGPLPFNIYVAGLPSVAEQHNASLPSFADDMSLYCSRKTEEEACRDASQALDAISLSLQEIGLTMNTDKTTAIVVNPRRKTQSIASQTAGGFIYCQGRQVAIVSCSRVLGVIIDNNLTWSAHVDAVHSKVARKIGALKRSSRQLTRQARRSFFLTVIQPDLEYSAVACIPNMPELQKQRLLTLWRKAVRCVAGAERHADVDPICKELSLTPLDHRWALKLAMLDRRCYMNQAPAPLCRKLKRTSHHRSTRGNNMSLHPFKPSSLSSILSFSNRSPILWNALQSVPNLCSLTLPKFKKVFTKLFLDSPKYISYAVGDVNRYTWCGSYILLSFLHFLVFSFFS